MYFSNTHVLTWLLTISLANCNSLCSKIQNHASLHLSSNTTIQCDVQDIRWSEFAAPQPGAIVSVGTEDDVAALVTFANENKLEFLLQNGGHGWADTFKIGADDFIIDISQLKTITFNAARTEVQFQAGVLIGDLVSAAFENNARLATGTCNCVGALGAVLGGGLGREQGIYGQGVDQLLSITYVNAHGRKEVVTPQTDPDLWFAFTGAGPNFGLVTSVVYKSYPVPQAENTAWTGSLIYDETQLESLMSAINNLVLEPEMQLDFTYTGGAIVAVPFYIGTEDIGMQKFASLLNIGPIANSTGIVPYNMWNSGSTPFCVKGGRKPSYGINLKEVSPVAWQQSYNDYISFLNQYPEANATTILSECYPPTEINFNSSTTSFPWRDNKCYVSVFTWYTHESLDGAANQFGQNIRTNLISGSGAARFSSYINFAHGDESLTSIYGANLGRLQKLKVKYDPLKRFNQWFPLS